MDYADLEKMAYLNLAVRGLHDSYTFRAKDNAQGFIFEFNSFDALVPKVRVHVSSCVYPMLKSGADCSHSFGQPGEQKPESLRKHLCI